MPGAQELTLARTRVPALSLPRVAVRHGAALVVLTLAALSFLLPSAPTYDPWAWIIWGREVLHLDLSTGGGPSWKPLPVLLTTPFALLGDLAPDLWLFTARAAAIAGVLVVFRVARRLGGVPAGAAAAAAYAVAPWTIRNAALGNSEGMLVALALGAVDRHLDGRRHAAFALGIGAALLRPEAWPFVGLYGAWLAWRQPPARRLVGGGFAALPVLWLLPELWGSGDLLRAAHRAQSPNADSPAFANDPIRAVLDQFASMQPAVVWVGLIALAVALRRAPGRGEVKVAAALLAAALAWTAEVAAMTSDGFAGNARYLILPAALLCVLAGTGASWLACAVLGRRAAGRRAAVALAVLAAAGFAAPSLHQVAPRVESLSYDARLNDGLEVAVLRAGGPRRLLACGGLYTGRYQVPVVAWHLGVHLSRVHFEPHAPATVFRSRNSLRDAPQPPLDAVGGEAGVTTLAIAGGWRVLQTCDATG